MTEEKYKTIVTTYQKYIPSNDMTVDVDLDPLANVRQVSPLQSYVYPPFHTVRLYQFGLLGSLYFRL